MKSEGNGNTDDLNIEYLILPCYLPYNRMKITVMSEQI